MIALGDYREEGFPSPSSYRYYDISAYRRPQNKYLPIIIILIIEPVVEDSSKPAHFPSLNIIVLLLSYRQVMHGPIRKRNSHPLSALMSAHILYPYRNTDKRSSALSLISESSKQGNRLDRIIL